MSARHSARHPLRSPLRSIFTLHVTGGETEAQRDEVLCPGWTWHPRLPFYRTRDQLLHFTLPQKHRGMICTGFPASRTSRANVDLGGQLLGLDLDSSFRPSAPLKCRKVISYHVSPKCLGKMKGERETMVYISLPVLLWSHAQGLRSRNSLKALFLSSRRN